MTRTRIEICVGKETESLIIDDPSMILKAIDAKTNGRTFTIVKVENQKKAAEINAKIKKHLDKAENDRWYAGSDCGSARDAGYAEAENETRKASELETELMLYQYWKVTVVERS